MEDLNAAPVTQNRKAWDVLGDFTAPVQQESSEPAATAAAKPAAR